MVLDQGPHCSVENRHGHHVLDLSRPAADHLFRSASSTSTKMLQTSANEASAAVIVEPVSANTPLGPSDGSGGGGGTSSSGPFIGDGCSTHEDCNFNGGYCGIYDDSEEPIIGFCTTPCEGYCPDKAGKAGTFCTSLDGGQSGYCVSKSESANGYCSNLPGMGERNMPRHIGNSSAQSAWADVCAPVN
jgi:hypothetical protein